MGVAYRIGLPLSEFWQITPWQLNVTLAQHHEKTESETTARMGLAWYTAAFTRAAKLPPLAEILGIKKTQSKNIDERAIMASLRKYQKLRDEKSNGN